MRALVTGCSGFIGRHLCLALLERGDAVVGLSRVRPDIPLAAHFLGEIDDPSCREAARGCDIVFHLAGLADASSSFADPCTFGRVNTQGTLNMLEAARQTSARFVLASTQRVYPPRCARLHESTPAAPTDPYGYSKLLAEQWAAMYSSLYSVPTTVLRLFSVYGPGQMVRSGRSGAVSILCQRALAGAPLQVDVGQVRDFTYVADVVQAMLLCGTASWQGAKTYNVGSGKATSMEELAQAVCAVTGSSSEIVTRVTAAQTSYVPDIGLIRSSLGYSPAYDLRKGLELYVDWLRRSR